VAVAHILTAKENEVLLPRKHGSELEILSCCSRVNYLRLFNVELHHHAIT